jgi:hypothetical protein
MGWKEMLKGLNGEQVNRINDLLDRGLSERVVSGMFDISTHELVRFNSLRKTNPIQAHVYVKSYSESLNELLSVLPEDHLDLVNTLFDTGFLFEGSLNAGNLKPTELFKLAVLPNKTVILVDGVDCLKNDLTPLIRDFNEALIFKFNPDFNVNQEVITSIIDSLKSKVSALDARSERISLNRSA